jgi:4-amino-4-deoxy-L-arabinose transferase-like glycosyltransferase
MIVTLSCEDSLIRLRCAKFVGADRGRFPKSDLHRDMNKETFYAPLLVFLSVFLFFIGLGARDFWAPVEPRYAEIIRVMFFRGEWIVPTINGDLYTDKPILYFWFALLGAKVFGAVTDWTVRLPAALGGMGFVLATYLIGRDFLNARAGLIGAAVLATSMRVLWEARWAHVDTVFCAFFMFSLYFGARSLLRVGKANEILLAYLFVALATLTKGLIGIVLPGLLFAALMLTRRDRRMIVDAKLHLGVPIFFLVAGPWFYLVARATDAKWLTDFIYIHHIQRYTAGAGHRQPFYYYLTTLPADFLPWTVFVIPALLAYRPYRSKCADPTVQFFLLWFLTVFLFFTLSDTKRDLYLLPLLPTLALLVGKYLDDLGGGKLAQDAVYRWMTVGFFASVAVCGFCLPLVAWYIRRDAFSAILPASIALLVSGICAAIFVRRRQPLMLAASVAAMMALTVICASIAIMPYLENFKSPRPFAQKVTGIVPPAAPIYIYADTMNDFNYYTGREIIPVLPAASAVDALLARGQGGYLLVKDRDLRRLTQLPREWIVASDERGATRWHLIGMPTHSAQRADG